MRYNTLDDLGRPGRMGGMARKDSLKPLVLVAAALVLLAAGCGGSDGPSDAYRNCQRGAENAARADALRIAYEQGRLGTQAEVSADFPGGGEQIFDEEGRMIPYEELRGLARARFDEWAATDDYPGRQVQLEMLAAERRVEDAGWPDCDDLK